MATIRINGTNVTYTGRSVTILNGRVLIDGQDATPADDVKTINIQVQGDIESIEADACETINVTGSVHDVRTHSGDIMCGEVAGGVRTTSGDVKCVADIRGSVETISGDVSANAIHGRVRTITGRVR